MKLSMLSNINIEKDGAVILTGYHLLTDVSILTRNQKHTLWKFVDRFVISKHEK